MKTKIQLDKSSSGAPSETDNAVSASTAAAAAATTNAVPQSPVKKSDRLAQKRLHGGPLTGLAAAVFAAVGRPAKRPRTSVAADSETATVPTANTTASSSSSKKRGRPANAVKAAASSTAQPRRSAGRPPTKALQLQQQLQQKQKIQDQLQHKAPLLPMAAQRRSLGANPSSTARFRRLSSNNADELLAAAEVARDAVALPGRRSTDTLECNKQLKRLVSSLRDVCPAGYRACSLIDPHEVNAEAEAKVASLACLGLVPMEAGQAIREAIQGQALRLQLHRATSSRQPMRLCRHVHKRQPDPNILVLHNGKYVTKEEVRKQKQAAQALAHTSAAITLEQQRRRRLATVANSNSLKQRRAVADLNSRRRRYQRQQQAVPFEPRRHRLWPLCRQPNLRWSSQPTFSLHPGSAKFVKEIDVASDSLGCGGILSAEEDEEEFIDELLLAGGDGNESEGAVSSSVDQAESCGAEAAKSTASSGSQGFEVAGLAATTDEAASKRQEQQLLQDQQLLKQQQHKQRLKKQQTRPQTVDNTDQKRPSPTAAMRFGKRRQRRIEAGLAGGIENDADSASSSASLTAAVASAAASGGVRRSKRRVDLRSKLLQWKMFSEERKQQQIQQQQQQISSKRQSTDELGLLSGKPKVSIMDSDKKRQLPLQQQQQTNSSSSTGAGSKSKRQQKQFSYQQQQMSPSMPAPSLGARVGNANEQAGDNPNNDATAKSTDEAIKTESIELDSSSTVPKIPGSTSASIAGPSGIRSERKQIFASSASGSSLPAALPLSHSLTRELQALTNDLSCDVEIQRSMPFDKFIVNVVDLSLGDLETLQERLDDSSFKLRAVKHKLVNSTGLVFCAVLVQRKSNVIRSIRRMLDSADNWESSSSNASDAENDPEDEAAIASATVLNPGAGLSGGGSGLSNNGLTSGGVGHFTPEEVKAAVSYARIEKAAADAAAAVAATAASSSSGGGVSNATNETEADAAVASLQQEAPQPPVQQQPQQQQQPRQPTAFELLKMQRHQHQQQRHQHLRPVSAASPFPTQKVHLRGSGVPLSGGTSVSTIGPVLQGRHSQIRPAYPATLGIVLRHPNAGATGASTTLSPHPHGRLPLTTTGLSRLAPMSVGNSLIRSPMPPPPPPPPPPSQQSPSVQQTLQPQPSSTTIRLPTPNRVFNVHVSVPGEQEQPRQGPKRKSMIVLPEGDTLFIEGNHPNLESVINSVLESRPGFRQARAEAAAIAAAAAAAASGVTSTTAPTSTGNAASAESPVAQSLPPPPPPPPPLPMSAQQPVVARMVQQFPKTKAIIKNSFKTIQLQQQQLQQQQQQQQLTQAGPLLTQSVTYTVSQSKAFTPILRTSSDKMVSSIFDNPTTSTAAAAPPTAPVDSSSIVVTSAAGSANLPFKVSFKEYMNVKMKMEQKRQDELELTRGKLIDHLGRVSAVEGTAAVVTAPVGAAAVAPAAAPTTPGAVVSATAAVGGLSPTAAVSPSSKRILFPYSVAMPKWATRGQPPGTAGQSESAQTPVAAASVIQPTQSAGLATIAASPGLSTPVSAAPLGIPHPSGKFSILRAVPTHHVVSAQAAAVAAAAAAAASSGSTGSSTAASVAPPVLVLAAAQRTTDLQRQAAQFPVSLLKKSTILQIPHGVLPAAPAPVSVTVSAAAAAAANNSPAKQQTAE